MPIIEKQSDYKGTPKTCIPTNFLTGLSGWLSRKLQTIEIDSSQIENLNRYLTSFL